jgi:hypothetical protein
MKSPWNGRCCRPGPGQWAWAWVSAGPLGQSERAWLLLVDLPLLRVTSALHWGQFAKIN